MLWKHQDNKSDFAYLSSDCRSHYPTTKDPCCEVLQKDGMKGTLFQRILLYCWRDGQCLCVALTVSLCIHVHNSQISYSNNIGHQIYSMFCFSEFCFLEVSIALLHDDVLICNGFNNKFDLIDYSHDSSHELFHILCVSLFMVSKCALNVCNLTVINVSLP